MLHSFSSAISPHLTVTSAVKKIAGERPYCLSMPHDKPPRALALVRMPYFFSFMWSSWPKDYDASVYVEKAPYEYELWHIKDRKHYKVELRGELNAIPCHPETEYVEKPWPRPQAEHVPVLIGNKLYNFPAAKTSVRRNAALYYVSSFYTPTMLDVSGNAGTYHLSEKNSRSTTPAPEWRRKEELSAGAPADMDGWRFTPSGPLYFKTKGDSFPAANIVCESGCFLRFHKEPFDYYVEIPKQRIEAWRQIYDEVTTEVEGWRVDNIQSSTALPP